MQDPWQERLCLQLRKKHEVAIFRSPCLNTFWIAELNQKASVSASFAFGLSKPTLVCRRHSMSEHMQPLSSSRSTEWKNELTFELK